LILQLDRAPAEGHVEQAARDGSEDGVQRLAVPEPDPRTRPRRIVLQGEVANPASPPGGCYFHPRCPHAIEVCRTQAPAQEIAPARFVACHRAQELQLAGVE
jgi:peptide/nickel transport system ATP-binding protein